MAKQRFQNVRGMPDILPAEQALFQQCVTTFKRLAAEAGYGLIETPALEDKAVFVRAVGEGTDVVDKELYSLNDRSGNELALRPEGSAGVVRAYIQHGMSSWPQPVQLCYASAMFRYDRPQAGRNRQHHQVGVEMFGEASASADAHAITLASRFYKRIGLTQLSLQLNSIGDAVCRPKYKKLLAEYLTGHEQRLCATCRERLRKNPLRVLDCKEPGCQAVISAAPQILNHLCPACHAHFTGVVEYLDELGIAYELNPLLVRGLDYYSRTVFEFYGQREGAQASLGGGGRYDGLVELLGGPPTPAVGFGLGVERMVLELEAGGLTPPLPASVKVFVASLGEPARLSAFGLIQRLLDGGVGAAGAVDKNGIAAQLARANRLGVPYAVIIGQKEVLDQTVILRDMASGAQEMIPLGKVATELQKRFSIKAGGYDS